MSSTAPGTTNNLLPIPLSRTGRSLLLVLDLIEGFMWQMLPSIRNDDDGNGGTKRVKVSRQDRIDWLKDRLVMSAENAQVPHMAGVDWRADVPKYPTEVLIPAIKDGQYQYDEEGNVVLTNEKRWPYMVRGQTKLPSGASITVRPVVLCDGNGFLVPYVKPRQQNGKVVYDGVDGMVCFLFQDFDPWTWMDILVDGEPTYRGVPAALARPDTVARWDELVRRRAEQDSSYPVNSELVTPIAHNQFGRSVLKYRPQGHPLVNDGMLGILKPPRYRKVPGEINVPKDIRRWIMGDLVGKTLAMANGLSLIAPEDGGRYEPHKLEINEMWSWIHVRQIHGIWGANTRVDQHVIRGEQDPIDAMSALGLTLYSCSPFEVKGIVTRLLTVEVTDNHPVVAYLRQRGDLEADASEELTRRQMRAIEKILIEGARTTLRDARDLLINALGAGGAQAHGLSDHDIFGGDITPEKVREVHDNTEEDLLALAIVASQTAKALGLEVWAGNCWVLVEARKALVLQRASAAGIEMAPPPAVPAPTEPTDDPAPKAESSEGEQPPATT